MHQNVTMNNIFIFILLSFLVSFTPGPSIVFVIKQGIKSGFCGAIPTILGNISASAMLGVLSSLGIGDFLKSNYALIRVIAITGSIYLVFSGLYIIFSKFSGDTLNIRHDRNHYFTNKAKEYMDGFVANIANPKIALFYLLVIPQFVGSTSKTTADILILSLFQIIMKSTSLVFYSSFTYKLSEYISEKTFRVTNSFSGIAIIIAGVFLLLDKVK